MNRFEAWLRVMFILGLLTLIGFVGWYVYEATENANLGRAAAMSLWAICVSILAGHD